MKHAFNVQLHLLCRSFAVFLFAVLTMNLPGCAPTPGAPKPQGPASSGTPRATDPGVAALQAPAPSRPSPNYDLASLPAAQPRALDLQGHRGMRAHWPENSILGMEEAVAAGVTTLEMDVVIASDGQPLLSHEPWLSPEICRTPLGQPIAEGDHSWNLFTMPVEDVAKCDCGAQGHPRFPQQRPVPTTKPTLAQLFEALRDRAAADPRFATVRFNIELKHRPEGDGIHHPDAATFAQAVLAVLDRYGVADRTTLQSFSAQALEAVHAARPDLSTAWLVEEEGSTASWLDLLTFTPSILSPDYALLSQQDLDEAHARGLKVIPWTVNDATHAEALIRMGVDGLITDDPYLVTSVLTRQGCTVK
jgi:glycerophosphoryl diester phosphodiesterase